MSIAYDWRTEFTADLWSMLESGDFDANSFVAAIAVTWGRCSGSGCGSGCGCNALS